MLDLMYELPGSDVNHVLVTKDVRMQLCFVTCTENLTNFTSSMLQAVLGKAKPVLSTVPVVSGVFQLIVIPTALRKILQHHSIQHWHASRPRVLGRAH